MAQHPFIIINEDLPLKLEFPTNPSSIDFDSQKVYQESRTIGGYVFEHWGKRPTTIDVAGLIRKSEGLDFTSEAYWSNAFFALKQVYELDKRRMTSIAGTLADNISRGKFTRGDSTFLKKLSSTILYYRGTIYKGFFTRFKYRDAGDTPWHLSYNFTFLSTYSSDDFLRDALLRATQFRNQTGGAVGTILRASVGAGLSTGLLK